MDKDTCDNCGGPTGKRGTHKLCATCYRHHNNGRKRSPGGSEYERVANGNISPITGE